jgi:hypothetical protein
MENEEIKHKRMQRGERPAPVWAYVLIGIGAFWLLANLGIFSGLWRLWPLILIVVGVLLLTQRGRVLPVKKAHLSAPLEDAQSARVKIHLSVGKATVDALTDSDQLIEADLGYRGEIEFNVSGDTERIVNLRQTSGFDMGWINPATWFSGQEDLRWDVGLSPQVPTRLDVRGGAGYADLDLSKLQLTGLDVQGGLGKVDLSLPAMEQSYDTVINVGVGEVNVTVPDGAATDMHIHGGVGEVRLDLPQNVAARVKARMGVGAVNVSSRFNQLSSEGVSGLGGKGVWETADYESADRRITIDFDGGIGELNVR